MALTKLPGPASRRRMMPIQFRARRAERFIAKWTFPVHIWDTVSKRYPQVLDAEVQAEVDHALRDWFICCAWRGSRSLAMPSRLVDEAWHALILDSLAYVRLCREAFGTYLHHFPESAPDRDDGTRSALVNTVWAWDRSIAGRDEESLLWDLDERNGVEDPWGVPGWQVAMIRSRSYAGGADGWALGAEADCPPDTNVGGIDGSGVTGLAGGGGSCSGGGCGGGGGGGS